jgi:N-acetylmannosamine-6-phosphate 2-epimerase/N-acetylmannosamine kinase
MKLSSLEKKLIVSCQAPDGDPFHSPNSMARFAVAAERAGAGGIRANGVEDIRAIRAAVRLPVIGIQKTVAEDSRILITPSVEAARAVVEAGAKIVALDCTARGRRYDALERLRRIQRELGALVMADIATVEEAEAAAAAGADLVASTMRGYTDDTVACTAFEPEFIRELADRVSAPVIAEGHISNPQEAAAAIRAGAFAVVVGTAITAPGRIAERFVAAIGRDHPRQVIGIDLGGTQTKYGIVDADGRLTRQGAAATPWSAGRDVLLTHLKSIAAARAQQAPEASAVGIATAGWVNPNTGAVAYATENLPGWTGARIGAEVSAATGLPVAVENDANALAVGERQFGAGRRARNFAVVTLGTGVGGGCYVDGELRRGAHFFANALGHMPVEPDGVPCTCGLRGCLEAYTNSAALLRSAPEYENAEQLIKAANAGDDPARKAIQKQAAYLASGLVGLVQLLDPELIVIAGGLAQNNPLLIETLRDELAGRVTVWSQRRLEISVSDLGYHAGVLGAAAVAFERF